MKAPPANVDASIHARLLAGAKVRNESFTLTLQRYAAERFLYRLGASPHRDAFILKGAMLFALWGGNLYRATRDIDFTGYGAGETEAVLARVREVCAVPCSDDGLRFDGSTLRTEPIRDGAEYHGLRIRIAVTLDSARIALQLDVGFGDSIVPPADDVSYPTLLDGPAPRIRAYRPEAVVAEKLHAIVALGERNSRFKDFYDLHMLAQEFSFDGAILSQAIAATFERRKTAIDPALPVGLAPRFFSDAAKAAQWRSYLEKNGLSRAPADFDAVGERLRAFIAPMWTALEEGDTFSRRWSPGGPWR